MKVTRRELRELRQDSDIEGVFGAGGRLYIDRRKSMEAITRLGLSPRTADLNVIGPEIVELEVGSENVSSVEEGDV